ncbi:fatty acyl-CoA reductase wat-like [Prorops nasuta]|uniref:fatty acyl-CoA reductase wat-like n=1 Tax=Prorops nasuta TaxID=863751 RepID=UPI0034CE75A9
MLLEHSVNPENDGRGQIGCENEANNNRFDEESRIAKGTPIQEFYAGQSIFITGGTGFLGKVLLEKLLRSCKDLQVIYLLIRAKKGVSSAGRLDELFQNHLFDRLKKEVPDYRSKVVAINGDCSLEGLGLSESDKETIINNVSIVFHVAATIRFDEKLKLATATNIRSSAIILEMCKRMPKLKSFIHVSTAYANCHLKRIEEKFYEHPFKYEEISTLVNTLPESIMNEITPKVIGDWPNTYTFTKAITESYMRDKSKGVPMGIFRPAIVSSTAEEPVPAWVDNFYGPVGIVAGTSSGMIRVTNCGSDNIANLIPVDLTVNALIASAWDVYEQTNRRDEDMLIYNYVSSVDAPCKWGEFRKINLFYGLQYPLTHCVWYLSLSLIKNRVSYMIAMTFLHLLPALLVDTVTVCVGQKPKMWKMYEKIHKMMNLVSHFCVNDWEFTNDNVNDLWRRLNTKDQQIFKFSMQNFSWNEYFKSYMQGMRSHLFKQTPDSLEESRKRLQKLYWMHQALKTTIFLVGGWFIWNILNKFLR